MKVVTYNTHFGVGPDGNYDIARIADAVRGADVIALQEVSRNNPANQGHDMVAELREALPAYFAVFGPNFEASVGSHVRAGKAFDVTFQLGNMLLSLKPITLSRNLLLPRNRSFEKMNFQRGALEALIETPQGWMRFYSTHLDHLSPDERHQQISFLKGRVLNYALEGGALTGLAEAGLPEPPYPEQYLVMGDFNMLEGSIEYAELAGLPDHEFGVPLLANRAIDAALRLGSSEITYADLKRPDDASHWKRIDYIFAAPTLSSLLKSSNVDRTAQGSDHFPLWLELS